MICASKPDQVYCFDLSHPIPNEKMKLTDAIFRRTLEYQAEIPELFILMKLIILQHYGNANLFLLSFYKVFTKFFCLKYLEVSTRNHLRSLCWSKYNFYIISNFEVVCRVGWLVAYFNFLCLVKKTDFWFFSEWSLFNPLWVDGK